jgi:hypothetical protein
MAGSRASMLSHIELQWERAAAKAFSVEVSTDGKTWKKVFVKKNGDGKPETIRFAPTPARWVRVTGTERTTQFGYSIWEIGVYR